jgi:hypothetical protein
MAAWLRYLTAFVVFAHGFIYVRIGSVLPGPITVWQGKSWLLGDGFSGEQLRLLVVSLHVGAGVAILASALAIAFAPSMNGWWRPLAITGAAAGLVAFTVFWDGQTRAMFEEGLIGALASLSLLIGAVAFADAFSQP